jgi:hypothetical protein
MTQNPVNKTVVIHWNFLLHEIILSFSIIILYHSRGGDSVSTLHYYSKVLKVKYL